MPKKNTPDAVLVDSIAQNLFDALPNFRKRVLHLDTIQRDYHIPLSHVQVLALLHDNGSLSVSEISKRLGIAKPNITPLVDRLIHDGLVERQRDEKDRRVVNIRICPDGVEKLSAIRMTLVEQVDDWSGDFSRSELKELNKSLGCIIRILGSLKD